MRAYDVHKAVKIELDEERFLYFNIKALMELEKLLGVSVYEVLQQAEKGVSMRLLTYGLATGLKFDDPSMTVDKAGDILEKILSEQEQEDFQKVLTQLSVALFEAIVKSGVMGKYRLPKVEPEEEEAKVRTNTTRKSAKKTK